MKFGISFNLSHLNQAGALVHVYTDGSMLVNHGGTEMGQGLNTKVAQVVAHTLGVPLAHMRATATDTGKVANTSATAASSGSDLNGKAAEAAARHIRDRLAAFAAERAGVAAADVVFADDQVQAGGRTHPFAELVREAYLARVQLWSDGLLRHPRPALGRAHAQRPPLLLLRLRRGGIRGRARYPDRRMDAAAGRPAARRRPLDQPGDRHRPGRGRLHPGHGLADAGRAGVERRTAAC